LKLCFIRHNFLHHKLSTMFLKKTLLRNGTVHGGKETTWHSNTTLMPFCSSSFLTYQITDPSLHDLLHNLWNMYLHVSS
jgi:hypothetical protein